MISRRLLLELGGGVAALVAFPGAHGASADLSESPSLKSKAAAKGLLFGSEVLYADLAKDAEYANLVTRECAIITPGNEAKWLETERTEGGFKFERLDWLVAFALEHGMLVRGHNLVWGVFNPPWVTVSLWEGNGREILERHIREEVGRYRGQIAYWDVVNEPTDPLWHPLPDGLVNTLWRRHIGADYIDRAFATAAEADPNALLFINDDTLEYDEPDREEKRNNYLRVIEGLLKRGVPIKGFGLESHLRPLRKIAEKSYRRFLSELAGMGLSLHITELDVLDRDLPADVATRDRICADYCRQFLDIALDEPAVKAVITWGLTDRYSYLNQDKEMGRSDGVPSRNLPFDNELRPKPLWDAIVAAINGAPHR